MITSLLLLLFVVCAPVSVRCLSESEPLKSKRGLIAQYKRRELCSLAASCVTGLAIFGLGVAMKSLPESDVGVKVAWSACGLSTALLLRNYYDFLRLPSGTVDIETVVQQRSNYLARHIGSFTVSGALLAFVAGFMGNAALMRIMLISTGICGTPCDTYSVYNYYGTLCSRDEYVQRNGYSYTEYETDSETLT